MKKRILSLLLCVSLLWSVTAPAFAAETNEGGDIHIETVSGCTECGGVETHDDGCSFALASVNEPVVETCATCGNAVADCICCDECGLASGHAATCSQYEPPVEKCGTCGNIVADCVCCDECRSASGHAATCSQYVVPVETCDSCGNAVADCICCDECGLASGHAATCSQHVPPVEICATCQQNPCVCVKTCETCGNVQCVCLYRELIASQTIEEMFERINTAAETNPDAIFALTELQIKVLAEKAETLPSSTGDEEYRELVIDTLAVLPNSALAPCEDCGYVKGHAKDCPWVLGQTLIASGSIGATTISSSDTWTLTGNVTLNGTITINEGVTLTINLADSVTRDISIIRNFTGTETASVPVAPMFKLLGNNSKLVIHGNSATSIVLDGGNSFDLAAKSPNYDVSGTKIGSAIYVDNHGDLDLEYVVIQSMYTANNGGAAIHMKATSTEVKDTAGNITGYTGFNENVVTMDHVTIKDCLTRSDSSILYIYGNVTMNDCKVENCSVAKPRNADDTSGGCYGGVIKAGGAQHYCELNMIDCEATGNYSGGWGGVILWACGGNGSVANLTNSKFNGNRAQYLGGAISVEGSVVLTGCELKDNEALGGGAIATFPFSLDTGNSGYNNACGLTLNAGNVISGNKTTSTEETFTARIGKETETSKYKVYPTGGGAIWSYLFLDGWSCELTISEGNTISDNESASKGGGILMAKTAGVSVTLNVAGGTISGNKAPNGAGAYINGGSMTMSGGSFSGNIAEVNGGAVYVSGGSVTMNGGMLGGTAETDANIAANGGAVYITGGSFAMNGGTVQKNTATENGGAVYVTGDGSGFTMSEGWIQNNTASDDGGAIYVSGGSFAMSGGTMQNNVATGDGGAAYVTGGSFTMNNGTIQSNSAANGGAAYVAGDGSGFTMSEGEIRNNKASTDGGAVYITGGSVNMSGGEMSYNSAPGSGGAVYVTNGNFTMTSGTMTDNGTQVGSTDKTQYGGAVYTDGGIITIGRADCLGKSDVSKHTAANEADHPVVEDNEAVFGGGLAINEGTVYIHCCKIMENTASGGNGAGENIFMNGGTVTQDYDATQIGSEKDPGIVSVGGQLNIEHSGGKLTVNLVYDSNYGDDQKVDVEWKGQVPDGYWLNMPYCPEEWEETQSGKTFVGWTNDQDLQTMTASAVRDKDDYLPIGTPVQLTRGDAAENVDVTVTFYAVWAPNTNYINYAYHVQGRTGDGQHTIVQADDKDSKCKFDDLPTDYKFGMASTLISGNQQPTMPGYTFQGWKLYASNGTISNWGSDPNPLDEKNVTMANLTNATAYSLGDAITTEQNFGDITLVALFTEDTINISYVMLDPTGSVSNTCGTIGRTEDTGVFVDTGSISDVIVSAHQGFYIKGWYLDAACTKEVTDATYGDKIGNYAMTSTLTPKKGHDGDGTLWTDRTYYVKFDYAVVDLVISTENMPDDQSFIFNITAKDGKSYNNVKFEPLKVAIVGNRSVTIKDIPVGEYTVSEESGWTWRYIVNTDAAIKEEINGSADKVNGVPTHVVTFSYYNYEKNGQLWLSGLSNDSYGFTGSITTPATGIVEWIRRKITG